ncbi:MAG: HEAT repeat domain-containing protein, partial [Planctomycetia bacterium]|nr:HEAT repeat domain-containing protein [Planctomycetia bacterium]
MFTLFRRLTTSLRAIRPPGLVGATAAVLLAGCQGWPGGASERFAAVAARREDSAAVAAAMPAEAAPGRAEMPVAADSATTAAAESAFSAAEVSAVLTKPDAWSLRPAPRGASPGEPSWRWQHPALEQMLAEPARLAPALRSALGAKDPTTRANAAIGLARLGDASGKAELVAAAQRLMPLRSAAAEALGSLAASDAVVPLRELMDRYGDVRRTARARYQPELHRELLAGLARHVDPADDARFLDALRSPDADVRAAALEAWARGRAGALPDAAADLAGDPDARVRAAAMLALARRRHSWAGQLLARGAREQDLHGRRAAIAG